MMGFIKTLKGLDGSVFEYIKVRTKLLPKLPMSTPISTFVNRKSR
jgi:hypothetical protein